MESRDPLQDAARLLADLQNIVKQLSEQTKARQKQDSLHKSEAAAWVQERNELLNERQRAAQAAQVASNLETELRADNSRWREQAQRAEQGCRQIQDALQEAQHQGSESASRASAAIRAAEILQAELVQAKMQAQQLGMQTQGQQALHNLSQGPVQNGTAFDGTLLPRLPHIPIPAPASTIRMDHPQPESFPPAMSHEHMHQPMGQIMGNGAPMDPRRRMVDQGQPARPHAGRDVPPHGGEAPRLAPQPLPVKRKHDGPQQGGRPQKPNIMYAGKDMRTYPRPTVGQDGGRGVPPGGSGGSQGLGREMHAPQHTPQHAPVHHGYNEGVRPAFAPGPGMTHGEEDKLGRQIVVHGIPYAMGWEEFKDLAGSTRCGPANVVRANIACQPDGRPRGFGTILFTSARAATDALEDLRGRLIDGRSISVSMDPRP